MIIKFSKPLTKVENFTLIDSTILNITVLSSYPLGDTRNLNISSWYTVFMSDKELRLQVNFMKPLLISSYDVIYYIKMINPLYS